MSKLHFKEGLQPFRSNQEIMAYARQQILCRPGFSPAPDHALLECEGYRPEKKQFNIGEFLEWLDHNRG